MTQGVYFIRAQKSGAIKIGIAINALSRLKELQTGCPEDLALAAWFDVECDGYPARYVESQLHARLAHRRLRGEWFMVGLDEIDDALRAIERPLPKQPKPPRIRRPPADPTKFDRIAYQREYMRKRRAAAKV